VCFLEQLCITFEMMTCRSLLKKKRIFNRVLDSHVIFFSLHHNFFLVLFAIIFIRVTSTELVVFYFIEFVRTKMINAWVHGGPDG
jgi:hypothetical protein